MSIRAPKLNAKKGRKRLELPPVVTPPAPRDNPTEEQRAQYQWPRRKGPIFAASNRPDHTLKYVINRLDLDDYLKLAFEIGVDTRLLVMAQISAFIASTNNDVANISYVERYQPSPYNLIRPKDDENELSIWLRQVSSWLANPRNSGPMPLLPRGIDRSSQDFSASQQIAEEAYNVREIDGDSFKNVMSSLSMARYSYYQPRLENAVREIIPWELMAPLLHLHGEDLGEPLWYSVIAKYIPPRNRFRYKQEWFAMMDEIGENSREIDALAVGVARNQDAAVERVANGEPPVPRDLFLPFVQPFLRQGSE